MVAISQLSRLARRADLRTPITVPSFIPVEGAVTREPARLQARLPPSTGSTAPVTQEE